MKGNGVPCATSGVGETGSRDIECTELGAIRLEVTWIQLMPSPLRVLGLARCPPSCVLRSRPKDRATGGPLQEVVMAVRGW